MDGNGHTAAAGGPGAGDRGGSDDRAETRTEGRASADSRDRLTVAVVMAVSDASDVPPEELRDRLHDRLDPDALNDLFADRRDGTPRRGGRLVFPMAGCEVTVYGDGQVVAVRR